MRTRVRVSGVKFSGSDNPLQAHTLAVEEMLTRVHVRQQIQRHLDGALTLEDLAAWAEEAFRSAEIDPDGAEQIQEVLSVIRDAVDPHRFRWEEPKFEELLTLLNET